MVQPPEATDEEGDPLADEVSDGEAVGLAELDDPAGLLAPPEPDWAELGLLLPLHPASSATSAAVEASSGTVRRLVTRRAYVRSHRGAKVPPARQRLPGGHVIGQGGTWAGGR